MRQRTKKGTFAKELNYPTLVKFYCERYDRDWLREQALKKSVSVGGLIRSWIKRFKK